MTGGKGIFVPAFVGDIHRAEPFACWLIPSLICASTAACTPIRMESDAFR